MIDIDKALSDDPEVSRKAFEEHWDRCLEACGVTKVVPGVYGAPIRHPVLRWLYLRWFRVRLKWEAWKLSRALRRLKQPYKPK